MHAARIGDGRHEHCIADQTNLLALRYDH